MTRKRATGFTLTELTVSMSVLALVAALLFPVFASAVGAAKRTQCINNFRQTGAALALYMADHNGGVPPVNHTDVDYLDPGDDQTWVQTLLPYVGHFGLFMCPSDTGRTGYEIEVPEGDGSGGDPWKDFYQRSLRSNLGYNYLVFSPLVQLASGEWRAFPIGESQVSNPAGTLIFIDSVWDRTAAGHPFGGGSWVVVPPCRYLDTGGQWTDTFRFPPGTTAFFGFDPGGWQPESSISWLIYGGAWPWHKGRFNMMFFDGHVKNLTLANLTQGCDMQPEWMGPIKDLESYIWDTNG